MLCRMRLNDTDLKTFQEIWHNVFHETISIEEAACIAADVMQLYALLGDPPKHTLSEADKKTYSDEVFSLLQKIERK